MTRFRAGSILSLLVDHGLTSAPSEAARRRTGTVIETIEVALEHGRDERRRQFTAELTGGAADALGEIRSVLDRRHRFVHDTYLALDDSLLTARVDSGLPSDWSGEDELAAVELALWRLLYQLKGLTFALMCTGPPQGSALRQLHGEALPPALQARS